MGLAREVVYMSIPMPLADISVIAEPAVKPALPASAKLEMAAKHSTDSNDKNFVIFIVCT